MPAPVVVGVAFRLGGRRKPCARAFATGANITDIVILVVAADDGVKDQTRDSIACARQAGVPIIVAINKIDKPEADVERVQNELFSFELVSENLGGDTLMAPVSALEKTGLDGLLDKVGVSGRWSRTLKNWHTHTHTHTHTCTHSRHKKI